MTVEYKVISDKTISGLKTKVDAEIADGLVPQGGVAVDTRKQDPVYFQVVSTGSSTSLPDLTQRDQSPQYPLGKIVRDEHGNEYMYVKNKSGENATPEYGKYIVSEGYTFSTTIEQSPNDPTKIGVKMTSISPSLNVTTDLYGTMLAIFDDDTEELLFTHMIEKDELQNINGDVYAFFDGLSISTTQYAIKMRINKGFIIKPDASASYANIKSKMFGSRIAYPMTTGLLTKDYCGWVLLGEPFYAPYS